MEKLEGEFILNKPEQATEEEAKKIEAEEKKEAQAVVQQKIPHPSHFYSSFTENPTGIYFAEQEQGEEILLLLRRHFITNLPWMLTALFFAILPISFPFAFATLPITPPQPGTIALLLLFYYLVLFGFVLVKFTLWYFHTGIVTTRRLIDIDLHGILYRQVSETKNKNIEDVSYDQIGFVRSLFNYGDVHVQTAGAENNIEYDRVPRPSIVADIIGDLQK